MKTNFQLPITTNPYRRRNERRAKNERLTFRLKNRKHINQNARKTKTEGNGNTIIKRDSRGGV